MDATVEATQNWIKEQAAVTVF